MSYNYDPSYLALHAELVQKLIQVAQSGELLIIGPGEWSAIRNQQARVNNLLVLISKHITEFADIRRKVRSWTNIEGGECYLYVGQPQGKLSGRPPGQEKMNWRTMIADLANARNNTYVNFETLDSSEALAKFVGRVTALSQEYKRAEAKVIDLDAGALEYFAGLFEPYGWTATAEGETLILTRP